MLVVPAALDSGITWDEESHRTYGRDILTWFRSGFRDRAAIEHVSHLYGGLFDLPAYWIASKQPLGWGEFETLHVLTAFTGLLGVLATWKIAARVAGPRAGFFGAATLVLTPCWFGHALFNSKDIPFGTASGFVAYSMVCIVMRSEPMRVGDALRAGLSVGAAVGVRSGGAFLIGYPAGAALVSLFMALARRAQQGEPLRIARSVSTTLGSLSVVTLLAWLLMVFAWPWAQEEPLSRPFEAARIAAEYPWKHVVLFDGQYILSTELPRRYLPTWFALTLPEFYLVGGLYGIAAIIAAMRRRATDPSRAVAVLMLIAFVAAPVAGVLINRPIVYDAQRHFLFLLPPLAALIGLAIDAFLVRFAAARLAMPALLTLAVAGAITLFDMVSLHPYQYVYFNRISGGLRSAYGRFETDYWGASYREGFEWVVENIRRDEPVSISTCHQNVQLRYLLDRTPGAAERFRLTNDGHAADIYLAFTRGRCHWAPGEVVHRVVRHDTPLLYVFER